MTIRLLKPFRSRYFPGDIVSFEPRVEEQLLRQQAAVRVGVKNAVEAKEAAKAEKKRRVRSGRDG